MTLPKERELLQEAIGVGVSPVFGGAPPSIVGGGGSGGGGGNTTNFVGVGATAPTAVAVNSVGNFVQVGA